MSSIQARNEQIISMRKNGATYAEIARETAVSNNTVYQTLARADMINKSSRSRLSDEQKTEIVEKRRADPKQYTYMQLAIEYNCQPPTINKILRAAGLVKSK